MARSSNQSALSLGSCFRNFFASSLLLLSIISPTESLAQSQLVDRPAKTLIPITDISQIPASDRELAEQLEMWPFYVELYDKKTVPSPERKIQLRLKIREAIMEGYLDAASVQAEAQREIVSLSTLRQDIIGKRDQKVAINNAANFITSGALNTIGSILDFSTRTPLFEGNICQLLSGAVSSGMSTYALKQGAGGKTRGQGDPTVIAELFGRPTSERADYPESVWRFLHGHSLDERGKTRAQVLEERWIKRHYLEKHGSHRESLKIDLVSGAVDRSKSMTIKDLNDQIAMIADISEIASRMTHHLRDLMGLDDSDLTD